MWQEERDADNAMGHHKSTTCATPTSNYELTSLLDTLPEALIFLDRTATIQYANARAVTMLKVSKRELVGTTLWQHAPHLITTAFYQALISVISTREPLEVEYCSPLIQSWLHVRLLPTNAGVAIFISEERETQRLQNPFHRSERRYQNLLQCLSDHVAILTPQGLLLEINEPPLIDAHVQREEVIGKPFVNFPAWSSSTPADQEQLRTAIERASQGETVRFAARVHPRLGIYLDLDLTITPHYDIDLQVEYLTCTGHDVTERKRAEEELRVLTETMPQLVWTTQPDGRLDYTNQRFQDFTYTDFEHLRDYGWRQFIHPEDIEETLALRKHSLETGELYENEYRLRDGRTGAYRWFLTRALPVRNEADQIVKWFGTATDIDEHKRTEEALRQSQAQVQALMASNIIGIFMAEGEKIFEANDTFLRMTGYSRDDLHRGQLNWLQMTAPEYITATEYAHLQLDLHEYMPPYEKEYIGKDGTRVPVLVGGIMTKVEPLETIYFVLDNSVRKELEQRKDDFLNMAGHELRTPLTALKLQTQMLKKQLAKQNIHNADIAFSRMETQLGTVTRLAEELFDLAKIQAGKLEYARETINLNETLQEIVEVLQQTQTTHTIVVHGAMDTPLIGDKDRLCQVFQNLISNAIKYSPDANLVEIDICTSSEAVTISVRDHGIGIPREQRTKIFERFYRAVTSERQNIPGLGIGLYIVSAIVQYHGGTITVESEIGKGSTFRVTLPIGKESCWRKT
jgi:PAS domain S-box-containing protein